VVQRGPPDPAPLLQGLLQPRSAKEALKDLAGAEADYDAALKINPHHAITYLNRAYARSLRKNYAGSLEDVAETLRLKPGFPRR
jgi:tetratricopeptide (TPR) repeat protein